MNQSDPLSILQEVKRLELVTRGAVDTLLKGSYKSTFRGQGLEFHQVREYYPEDDYRSIDWNVTARLNAPYVKTFVEERELQVILTVDLSASLWYGTGPMSKRETALRLCALLAFAAVQHHDRVGLLVFSDRVEYFSPRKGGRPPPWDCFGRFFPSSPSGARLFTGRPCECSPRSSAGAACCSSSPISLNPSRWRRPASWPSGTTWWRRC